MSFLWLRKMAMWLAVNRNVRFDEWAQPCQDSSNSFIPPDTSYKVLDANGANLKTAHNAVIFFVIATLLFVAQVPAQEVGAKRGSVKGIVSLESGTLEHATPEGIALELKPLTNGSAPTTAITDAGGNFEFPGLADGEYVLHLLGDGLEPFTATVRIEDGATVAQNVLVKLTDLTQRVEVKERADPLSTSSSSASKFTDKQLSELPLVEENFKESLPLTPGVIRTPDGKLTFRGAGEGQSMLQVNDFKMIDPVTGSFSIPVPLDAVQSVRVVKTPYSAENGGFSGGLTEVETVPPPESWKVPVRDLNVSLRGKNDHFVGIGRATPRVVFGGPLLKDKLSFSEVYEYDGRSEYARRHFCSVRTADHPAKHIRRAPIGCSESRGRLGIVSSSVGHGSRTSGGSAHRVSLFQGWMSGNSMLASQTAIGFRLSFLSTFRCTGTSACHL
jgi:hypothetical protein